MNDTDLPKQSHVREQFIIDGKIVSKDKTNKMPYTFLFKHTALGRHSFFSKHFKKVSGQYFCFEWSGLLVLRDLKSLYLMRAFAGELVHRKNVVFAKLQSFLLNKPAEWSEVLGGQLGIEPPLND